MHVPFIPVPGAHSLRYFYTGVSEEMETEFPKFSVVGLVDGEQISYYVRKSYPSYGLLTRVIVAGLAILAVLIGLVIWTSQAGFWTLLPLVFLTQRDELHAMP
ncbi:UNVERIFIED_CONTAM: hypothetical protein FKN15_069709 [Acipenser sinensis]